jgi:hypothetical protein
VIQRRRHLEQLRGLLKRFPVVAIIGARQVGKSTLARMLAEASEETATFFDLEDPAQAARLNDAKLALEPLEGLVVIDEVQHRPELFPVLRVLADRAGTPARFLVLGSASPDLLQQSSESLAGRIAYYELRGFEMDEVDARDGEEVERLWIRGSFPRSFLNESDEMSFEWRREFIRTFLERDLPQLGVSFPATALRRFWTMVAHAHGQTWNASAFARSFGVADTTVRRYLDLLTSTFVVQQVQPWHASLRKRQVKSPKVYLADSGLLHALLNLRDREDVLSHPCAGFSWEGFAINEVAARLGAQKDEIYFWATHAGAELDLLVARGRHRLGFEIKRTVAPKVTKSMRIALKDLKLDRLDVIHAGEATFPLEEKIRAVAVGRLWEDLEPLG